MMFAENTKTNKLYTALRNGKSVTAAQITARFGLLNPTAAISHMRKAGLEIVTESTKSKNGVVTTRYSLVA